MRPIDADRLMDDFSCTFYNDLDDQNRTEKLINDAPTVKRPHGKWIPCSERLPEEDGQYLITVKYKHVNDSYEDVFAEHGEWFNGGWDMFFFGHCGEVEDIIAWMPLPEPYKKKVNRNEDHDRI